MNEKKIKGNEKQEMIYLIPQIKGKAKKYKITEKAI